MSEKPKERVRVPHVFVLIFILVVATALAGLVIPAGEFERDADGRVVPGTFAYDGDSERPRGWSLLLAVLMAPLEGIEEAANVIGFILILGGTFRVIEESGALAAAIHAALEALERWRMLVIPASMVLFSLGGAIFGMSEEIIPFVLLFVPLMRAVGYRPIVAVAVPLIGSQVGFAGAMFNPFTIGIAQAIAGLPPLSGWEFRTGVWLVVTAIGIGYVTFLARRHRLDPEEMAEEEAREAAAPALNVRHVLVLASLAVGIVVIVWGIYRFEWYVTEIGGIFFAVGLLAGIFGRLSPDRIARGFAAGAGDLISAALVVGFARGIVELAEKLQILDTVLQAAAAGLGELPGALALSVMFLFQSALNFFVPSGSGQAALTMPIMAPLAELTGLTRQMSVLAFQLGDGFSNMIIPTSAVLMGSLEAGKVRYERWFAFAWPLQVILLFFGFAVLSLAVAVGFGP